MHFTLYNGLENCALGNVTLFQEGSEVGQKINELHFDFTKAETKFQELNDVNPGHYSVQGFDVTCQGQKFTFPTYKFMKTSPPSQSDGGGDKDKAQHVLFTLDPTRGWPTTRQPKIQESMYREKLDKSDTGLPIAKYYNHTWIFEKNSTLVEAETLKGDVFSY